MSVGYDKLKAAVDKDCKKDGGTIHLEGCVTCACMLSFSKGEHYHCAAIGQRPICPEEGGRRRDCPLKERKE